MAQKLAQGKRKAHGIRIKPREGLWINYQLRLRGITHQKLGDQLGIRRDTVTKVIRGIRRSARVEDALPPTLGYPSFEAMIAASKTNDLETDDEPSESFGEPLVDAARDQGGAV